jgi:hypothetical protein
MAIISSKIYANEFENLFLNYKFNNCFYPFLHHIFAQAKVAQFVQSKTTLFSPKVATGGDHPMYVPIPIRAAYTKIIFQMLKLKYNC